MLEEFDVGDKEVSKFEPFIAKAMMFTVEKLGSEVEVEVAGEVVVKSLLRIISDAREGNTKTKNNLTYNIFTLDALFQCVSNVHHKANNSNVLGGDDSKKRWYCINADLRHWFHQIVIPEWLRNLVQFRLEKKIYRPRTLPMGWYLSPPIAQTITWSMILGDTKEKLLELGVVKDEIEVMPQWLEFNDRSGGIFVLQDNIFIVTHKKDLAQKWSEYLLKQAAPKMYNAEFKKEGPAVIELVEGDNTSFTEFNGIDFFYDGWRVADRKNRENLLQQQNPSLTYQQISSMLGEFLWDHRVRGESALDHEELLSLY